jgi:hypothetical protein
VAIGSSVDFHYERGKEYEHPEAFHADESATILTLVGAETVKWVAEGGDVKALAN